MYEGPVVYESQVIDYFAIFLIVGIVLLCILFYLYTLSLILKKAEQKQYLAFIPIVNIFPLIKITNLSNVYFILLLIPIINIFALYKLNKSLATVFKKDTKFALGLLLLPFIFYPILAFSNSRYIGINEEKVAEVIIKDLVNEQQTTPTESPTILKTDTNISVGTTTTTVMNSEDNILKADASILQSNKNNTIEYIECPQCKNKVKKGASTCFICGHKFHGENS